MKLFLGTIVLLTTVNCYSQNDSISKNRVDDDIVYDIVSIDNPPQYPGGEGAMLSFVSKNFRCPLNETDKHIQGKVVLKFIIDTLGMVTNPSVYKGIQGRPSLDDEAIRVLRIMPKWKPGTHEGKKVKCSMILPIAFKL